MTQRRGHNEGTIFRREGKLRRDGTRGPTMYVSQLTFEGTDGRKHRKTLYGQTRKEVQDKLEEARLERRQGRLTPSARQTVSEYLDAWLQVVEHSVRYSAFVSYKQQVRRLKPYIGDVRLDHLKPAHVQQAYADLQGRGLSARSVQLAHVVLHNALKQAVQLDLIPRNPTELVKAPRPVRHEMKTLTAEQADHLFRHTEDDRWHTLWIVLCTTGLRLGEGLGLRWKDIDLAGRMLTVQRAVQRQTGKGLILVEPKTAMSRRSVHLTTIACDSLRIHRTTQLAQRLALGARWEDRDMVFASELGRPLDPSVVSRRFQVTLRSCGLQPVRLHDLRHTAATLMLREGVHPRIVQEMLGHVSISVTLDTYSHVLPTMHREAVSKLDDLFAVGGLSGRSRG